MGIEIHHFLFYLDEVFLRTELVLLMRGVAVWRINHVYEITWIIKSFKQSTWLLSESCDCHKVGWRNFPNGLEENSIFFWLGGRGFWVIDNENEVVVLLYCIRLWLGFCVSHFEAQSQLCGDWFNHFWPLKVKEALRKEKCMGNK